MEIKTLQELKNALITIERANESIAESNLHEINDFLSRNPNRSNEFVIMNMMCNILKTKLNELFFLASKNGCLKVFTFLFKHLGTDAGVGLVNAEHKAILKNCETPESKKTALHLAAENGHVEIVDYLLSKGVDINQQDCVQKTALHLAAENGHVCVVAYLRSKGADVNLQDVDGKTVLHSIIEKLAFFINERNKNGSDYNYYNEKVNEFRRVMICLIYDDVDCEVINTVIENKDELVANEINDIVKNLIKPVTQEVEQNDQQTQNEDSYQIC